MKFTPMRRRGGWLICGLDSHDINHETPICEECGAMNLTVETSTHMSTVDSRSPLLCLPCGQRYKDLYEAGFFALETIVGA